MSLLAGMIGLPVLGMLGVSLVPQEREGWHHRVALAVVLLQGLLLLGVLRAFDTTLAGPQLRASFLWTVQPGTSSALGVDGLSLPLVALTVLLFAAAVRSASTVRSPRSFHAWLLLLQAAVLGVLLAQDWALFYAFWELMLVPLFMLIGRWGGARRGEASIAFLQYTMGGSIFTLLALLGTMAAVGLRDTGMEAVAAAAAGLPVDLQAVAFVGLCTGFAVKLGMVPLHGWLPLADVEASSPVAMLLSGVLVKLGAYGFLRASLTLPGGAALLAPALASLGAFGVLYGALLAWRQDDLKALAAYGTLSHMGMLLLSIATLRPLGWAGASLQMLAHGCASGLLFHLAGVLEERAGTRSLSAAGGLATAAPWTAALLVLALLGSTALPGLAGFPGELHALVALMDRWPVAAGVALLGGLVWAAAVVRALDRLVLGPVRAAFVGLVDLDGPPLQAAAPLALGIVLLGVWPGVVGGLGEVAPPAVGVDR